MIDCTKTDKVRELKERKHKIEGLKKVIKELKLVFFCNLLIN